MSDRTIALVTGANKGIGYEIAAGLGALGWRVGVGARDQQRRETAVEKLRAAGTDAFGVPLDVDDDASVAAAAELIADHAGGLDVLVNNAAITGGMPQTPTTVDPAAVRAVVETNVIGVIRVTNVMLPMLRGSASPRIVNMSSSVGSLALQTTPGIDMGPVPAAYLASKTFLNAVTVQYVKELSDTNILINSAAPVSPPPTSTASEASAHHNRGRRSRFTSRPCPTTDRPADSSTTPEQCPGDGHTGANHSRSRSQPRIARRRRRKTMTKAVRYDEFGGIDVLRIDEVNPPVPEDRQVLVQVKAAGINPGEAAIRTGAMADIFPSTFPSGQGSDLAGVVVEIGAGADRFSVGDEVIGFSERRAAQAELALVDVDKLTPKPKNVSWEVAGGLYVAGVTAWGAVHSVQLEKGESVVISGAAGGVGSLAVQLARRAGATVIGLASDSNHEWLQSHSVIPVAYGDGVADRIKAAAPNGIHAFIDTYGGGYVELALGLGVAIERIDTIADFAAAAMYGVKTEPGTKARPGAEVLAELAGLIADGHLEVPIASIYPLTQVRQAYTELERRHTHGKIVLRP